jgi:hypothetical protein
MSLSRFLAEIKSKIVDNLTTGGVDNILSAEQGKVLKGLIDSGIKEYDIWFLTTTFTGAADPIASNLSRWEQAGWEKKGTGMSQSSGVFTFPSTGYWEVQFFGYFVGGATKGFHGTIINYTNDNFSTKTVAGGNYASDLANGESGGSTVILPFKREYLGNDKLSFRADLQNSSTQVLGNSTVLFTWMIFKKMGDL